MDNPDFKELKLKDFKRIKQLLNEIQGEIAIFDPDKVRALFSIIFVDGDKIDVDELTEKDCMELLDFFLISRQNLERDITEPFMSSGKMKIESATDSIT